MGLNAAASTADAGIHKKMSGSGTTTLITSNNEMEDTMIKSLENSSLLLKEVSETIYNEVKEQKGEFLSTLLGILGPCLLGNMLASKGINKAGEGFIKLAMDPKGLWSRTFNAASSFN